MNIQGILTNEHISTAIIDIIKESKKYCFIVSPFFQSWPQLEKALEMASSENKKVVFLFRDKQDSADAKTSMEKLNSIFGFDVFFIENLHAKIYLNENSCLITSMNLYNHSKENNYEIGYTIKHTRECKDIAEKIIIGEMIKYWTKEKLPGKYSEEIINGNILDERKNVQNNNGRHCIRCGKTIYGNKIMCYECNSTWEQFKNPDYPEKYCVHCGKEADVTYGKPLCNSCFYNSGI